MLRSSYVFSFFILLNLAYISKYILGANLVKVVAPQNRITKKKMYVYFGHVIEKVMKFYAKIVTFIKYIAV